MTVNMMTHVRHFSWCRRRHAVRLYEFGKKIWKLLLNWEKFKIWLGALRRDIKQRQNTIFFVKPCKLESLISYEIMRYSQKFESFGLIIWIIFLFSLLSKNVFNKNRIQVWFYKLGVLWIKLNLLDAKFAYLRRV